VRAGRLLSILLGSLAAAAMFSAPQASAAASAVPQVEIRMAAPVDKTSATIEAAINPEGGETGYEIFLECQSAAQVKNPCEPLTVSQQRQVGVIGPGSEAHIVTAAVSGLQPGYLYEFAVIASNSAGREGYVSNGLLTCPATGACPAQPWLGGTALWSIEAARRAAEEAPRLEAERQARQKEAEERLAREAAALALKERAAREAGERAGREAAEREAAVRRLRCVVPRLSGDSLAAARRVLAKAHCALGKVRRPRTRHGALVVAKQSVPRGRKLANGAKVAVTLRPARS
jgi:hypothetical protein